jgi:hypothetical protein
MIPETLNPNLIGWCRRFLGLRLGTVRKKGTGGRRAGQGGAEFLNIKKPFREFCAKYDSHFGWAVQRRHSGVLPKRPQPQAVTVRALPSSARRPPPPLLTHLPTHVH